MKSSAIRGLIIAAFAVAVGHLAWQTFLGPPRLPDYFVGGESRALAGTRPEDKNLYLRRKVFLSQRPRHAWLQVIGRDRLRLWVNGTVVEERVLDGFPVAIVADITPYLDVGPNVVAITARQRSVDVPPVVTVEGGYVLADGEHPLSSDESWRCNASLERRAKWWFETDFDDNHWDKAQVSSSFLQAKVRKPPRAVTTPSSAHWITAAVPKAESVAVRRDFEVPGRPQQAWLRLTATASYRLAVNGIVLDQQEDQLGTTVPVPPAQRTYDLTPVLRRGRNTVALLTSPTAGPMRLLADLEVIDEDGNVQRLGTDGRWLACAGVPPDWLDSEPGYPVRWSACQPESGDLGGQPWQFRRDTLTLSLPYALVLERVAVEAGLMALLALVTLGVCRYVARLIPALASAADPSRPAGVVYLALVPAALAIAGGTLATYDPRIASQDVYRVAWLVLALVSVPLQWGFLALTRRRPAGPGLLARSWARVPSVGGAALVLAALLVIGFCLRLPGIESEPLMWDEVAVYDATQGLLERGFPSSALKDLPVRYTSTSELLFASTGLSALVFDDPRYIVRFPAVLWSVAVIGMLYVVGRGLFSKGVGLVAATIYTFAPACIAVSNFGRYFDQLQFFTLLTVYCYWLAIRGPGPINHRALWLTAVSFCGMYLTWEGSALIAPGMVLAVLVQRRGRLSTVLGDLAVWASMLVVFLVIVLQYSHRTLQQTQFQWYGTSISDVTLRPMWQYPGFNLWYYVWQASWSQDALLPMLGLLGAAVLAVRHAFRTPARFLLLVHVGGCLIMALLLPVIAWRYIHHQVPLQVLLASAVVVAVARSLTRLARQAALPAPWQAYARFTAVLFVVSVVALGGGATLQLAEMENVRVEGYRPSVFKFPNLEGSARYVADHGRPGDAVLASQPFQNNHFFRQLGRSDLATHAWPESVLQLMATLDDERPVPLDRRDGTVMEPRVQGLRNMFARHQRVWFVMVPSINSRLNNPEMCAFLRQHMDVVYEDWGALVLLRDSNNRPALLRQQGEEDLAGARSNLLP